MAMIQSRENMETTGPEGPIPIPASPHAINSYSSNPAKALLSKYSCEGIPARDSGVDVSDGLQEPKDENCPELHNAEAIFQSQNITPLSEGEFVSKNFVMNPIENGMSDMGIGDLREISVSSEVEGIGGHSSYSSVEWESFSSRGTESTIVREESLLSETSDSLQETIASDTDNRIYQPEKDDEMADDDEGFDLQSNLNMQHANIVIDKSNVHFGSNITMPLPTNLTKVSPNLNISSASDYQSRDFPPSNTQGLHININTPPVQPVTSHFPINKTQSTPVSSVSSVSARERRENPRLAENHVSPPMAQLPHHNSMAAANATLTTPTTPAQGNFHISGAGSVILGPQIIFSSPQCRDNPGSVNTSMEKVLKEAEERLALTYKHQTKRSLLPWLKGHQIMTDFYTESRILAVDRQGKQTRQTVNLVKTLVQDDENRFILEGEPGMGKTLLACKLAIDWANKKSLQKFKFVFLIFLRDFKDRLEDHVKEELLSSLSDEKFRQVWDYCKNNEEQVLFILDGYDELEKSDESKIQKLIESRDFLRSKVVVTSRPDVLRTVAQRIIVKGFNEAQMFEFIGKYFKLVSDDSSGHDMKRIIEKDYKYRKLAKRPLFCVLLCMLYDSDVVSKLPERLSDLMFKIMLCLIKWNNKRVSNVDENTDAFPPKYEELFLNFGKLSLKALKTDKTRFSEKEILEIGDDDTNLLLQLGFLSNDSENDVLGPKKFWKPVHKIFLEYLSGLYIANHISRECRDCKECREFSSVYHHENVLQFVVGTLDKRAHLALDGRKYQKIRRMKDTDLLMLLREAGPTKENCRAVAKLLDHSYATVYTSEVDFEGWGSILAQKFSNLKTLEIVWRIKSSNPDQESSFTEATPEQYSTFFNSLKSNTSINKIKIRATQDGEPFSEEKIRLFFSNLEMVLPKENLRELEIKELKMHVSSHLKRAIEGATCHMNKKALCDLERLRLDMFMDDEDLFVLCDRLRKCAPNLKELQLTGLVIGSRGFSKLVELLKMSKSLQTLHLSMDKARLQSMNDCTPSNMYTDQKRMNRQAVNESRRAFNERKYSQEAEFSSEDSIQLQRKVFNRGHRHSCTPSVTLEKVQQLDSSEYYTDAEINSINLENEENTSRERRSSCSPVQPLLSPTDYCNSLGSGIGPFSPKAGSRSPSLSNVNQGSSPSPKHDETSISSERMYFSSVKDPTKELSYLFQDPLNTGTKRTYMANHYSFVPGDGENNLPLPLCNDREHRSVFHDLFSALPESSVKSLTLDYPCLYLSTLDLVCLGDAIRKTKCLDTLKLQNLKNAKKYIPVVLGLGQCQSLTSVTLESKSVIITDASFTLACLALRNNTTLKKLSLAQWEFIIENKKLATRYFKDLMSNWKVNDLNLANCSIDIGGSRMAIAPALFTPLLLLPIHGPTHNWSSIKSLWLPHVKLKEQLGLERRGHLLLPVLRHCPNLTVLDLSASSNHITSLDDGATRKFFQLLGTNFRKLKELTLCNWEFRFKNYEETCVDIGQLVRSCTELRTLVLDKVSEVRSGLSVRTQCRATLLHQLINNLPRLSELSLCFYRIDDFELDKRSSAQLGACFHDHWNSTNKFKLKFFGLSPAAETALHDALMRDNFSVVISQGYPLEITVIKKRCLFAA
ncbi:uncharacterized protein [Palaemon carinicauda]|uniref:uncharacterized protein isoform X2 n=1 Tax=Palaemon carinicauda TaxID=392227 RepID=UPI0035B68C62